MESQPPCYFLNQINNRFFRKAFLPITERFFESLTPRFLLHLKSCGCLLQSVSSTVLHYLGSLFGTVRVFLAGVNPCVPQSFLQRSYATLLPHFFVRSDVHVQQLVLQWQDSNGRIPPKVIQDDRICSREIQSSSPSL